MSNKPSVCVKSSVYSKDPFPILGHFGTSVPPPIVFIQRSPTFGPVDVHSGSHNKDHNRIASSEANVELPLGNHASQGLRKNHSSQRTDSECFRPVCKVASPFATSQLNVLVY